MRKFFILFFLFMNIYAGINFHFDKEKDFTIVNKNPKFQYLPGDITIIGNTVLCPKDSNGNCKSDVNNNNSNAELNLKYIDIDNNPDTNDSSQATLSIPNGTHIVWAGLFIQGYLHDYNDADDENAIQTYIKNKFNNNHLKIKTPFFNHYHNLSLNKVNVYLMPNYDWSGNLVGYTYGFLKKITSLFKDHNSAAEVNGVYRLANILAQEGRTFNNSDGLGNFGAWTLVVIYEEDDLENGNLPYKAIQVFNGYKKVSTEDIDVTVSGFYTPKSGQISSKLIMFAGEGDKYISGDYFAIEGQKLTDGNLNSENNFFNSSISNNIQRNPSLINNQGIDIHQLDISNYLTNSQTSATFTFGTNGDYYFPSLLAFSTNIYVPKFCYDYAYSQNGIFFTEPYVPGVSPRLVGIVNHDPNQPVKLSVYIKSQENSDIIAKDTNFSLFDINTSQVDVDPDEIYVYKSEDANLSKVEANITTDGNETNVTDIPLGDIDSVVSRYIYMNFIPETTDLNMSINGVLNYIMHITTPSGKTVVFPGKPLYLKNLPICSNEYSYNPTWSVFNVSDKKVYESDKHKYNLLTQISGRANDYMVVSYDKDNLNQEKDYNFSVVLEVINAGGFHDFNASCYNPNAPIFYIKNGDGNSTVKLNVNFDGAKHVDENLTINGAIRNAAFRIKYIDWDQLFTEKSFNCDDYSTDGTLKGIPKCLNNNNNLKTVFGNNTPCLNSEITGAPCDMNGNHQGNYPYNVGDGYDCLRCLADYYGSIICSRDNFSVRPDSYYISIKDPVNGNEIINDLNSSPITKLAAGVNYKYDINATVYNSLQAASGYTRFFNGENSDYNISFIWSSDKNSSVCNDISDKPQKFYMLNGEVSAQEANNTEIGEYNLTVIDKDWTYVDQAGNNHSLHSSYFYSGYDCDINSSRTNPPNTAINVNGNELDPSTLDGCIITNSNHTSPGVNQTFKDINITYVPYKFDLSSVIPSYGINNETNFSNAWVYINDIIKYQNDENESLHFYGVIKAIAKGGKVTRNFVNGCFAKDLNFSVNYNSSDNSLPFKYVLYEQNGSRTSGDANNSKIFITKENFIKSNAGKTNLNIKLNYKKEFNKTISPIDVNLSDLNITPNNSNELIYEYNGTKYTSGELNLSGKNIEFRYGRIKVNSAAGVGTEVNTTFKYEYWTDDEGWKVNNDHNSTIFGDYNKTNSYYPNDINFVSISQNGTNILEGIEKVKFTTTHSIPYSAKIHLSIPSWLWYHPLAKEYKNPNAANTDCRTHPCMNINFLNSSSAWGGIDVNISKNGEFNVSNRAVEINATNEKNISKKGVKKINW
ncbi:conserved hypothetical protein [Lebetimonas natsushimae]|uniref:Uncharacterized protein n=1 Tax=Lebetimonas natsushimae TaxID=1936991 RepID=A0A292YB02_9BACT|nr:hypothetical protein [Lebetimonas natsushimae]GAX87257.1 conserved hypothetical protein [Lebetimonas natsushimae]